MTPRCPSSSATSAPMSPAVCHRRLCQPRPRSRRHWRYPYTTWRPGMRRATTPAASATTSRVFAVPQKAAAYPPVSGARFHQNLNDLLWYFESVTPAMLLDHHALGYIYDRELV